MAQRILGVDVGRWSVKAVLLESHFRGFRVERAVEVPLPPPAEGQTEEESLHERQALALTELMAEDGLRADAQVASFPGEAAAIRFVRLPFAEPRKVEQVMEGELEDLVPFELDDEIYHYQILERQPVRGQPGSSLSLAAAARKVQVRGFLDRLAEAEIDPKFLQVDVLGLHALYTHFLADDGTRPETPGSELPDEPRLGLDEPAELDGAVEDRAPTPPQGRLLVDIGHHRTLVLGASEKGVAHARVIRAGGSDVTRAIAKAYDLSFTDAENGKHANALLATARHPAANDDVQRLSDVIARGLTPLVRELRRTLAAIRSERRVEITRIDLLGGGARLENLPHFLAEALGVPVGLGAAVEQNVEPQVAPERRGAFGLALSAALRLGGDQTTTHIDLRRGELGFSGGLQHLRRRLPAMAGAAASLLALLAVYGILRVRAVDAREQEVDREFCQITKQVVGREICEPAVALSVMRSPPSDLGNFQLPETSAYDLLLELSAEIPPELKDLKMTDVSIGEERMVVEGDAPSFDAVDRLVAAYSETRCLQDIEKDKLRKKGSGDGVEFQLKMRVGCP